MADEADTFQMLPIPSALDDETNLTLTAELNRFAMHIAQEMQKDGIPFANKIDAFRALTAYHSASAKTKKLTGDDELDDDQPSRSDFASLKRQIRVVGETDGPISVKASTG